MKDVELAFVGAGNRLEALDAVELAFIRTVAVESTATDKFHRAVKADEITGEPDFTVCAFADAPDQGVIGNRERRGVGRGFARARILG